MLERRIARLVMRMTRPTPTYVRMADVSAAYAIANASATRRGSCVNEPAIEKWSFEMSDEATQELARELADARREATEADLRADGLGVRLNDAERDRERAGERERLLREALEFYAQQRGLGAVLASDGGQRARTALAASPGRAEKTELPAHIALVQQEGQR
jgi:hypothetical protein